MNTRGRYDDNPFFDKIISRDERTISNVLASDDDNKDIINDTPISGNMESRGNSTYMRSLRRERMMKACKAILTGIIIFIIIMAFMYIIMMIENKNAEYGMEPSTIMATSSIMVVIPDK